MPYRYATVRRRLLRLAILLLLPSLSLAGMVAWRGLEAENDAAKSRLRETAQSLARAIDGRLSQTETRLDLLQEAAQTSTPERDGLLRLMRVAAKAGARILLWDENGHPMLDTGEGALVPPQVSLSAPVAPADARLEWSWSGRRPGLRMLRPVALADGKHLLLTADLPAAILQEQIGRVALPRGWIGSAYSADFRHVARSVNADRFVGLPPNAVIRQVLARSEGLSTGRGVSLEGIAVRFAVMRSPRFGVPIAVLAPLDTISRPSRTSFMLLLGEGTLLVVLGIWGATGIARSITAPVERLAAAAREIGSDMPLPELPRDLREVAQVSDALAGAHATLRDRRAALAEMNASLALRVEARTAELAAANRALAAQREQLGLILDHMPLGVVVNQVDGTLLYANPVAESLLGLASADRPPRATPGAPSVAVRLRRAGRRVPPAEHPVVRAHGGISTGPELLALERADGSLLDVEVSSGPIRDETGAVALIVTTLADVSERVAAEETRRRSQRMEAVGQLTGGVAHEFNNLLMAIGGCLSLLTPALSGARERTLADSAARAVERGGTLTRQLLAFARRQNLQPEPVDVAALVRALLPLLETTVGRAVAIRLDLAEGAWPAMADAAQLELVLLNLAINARDAMPQGGELTISVANVLRGPPARVEEPPEGQHVALAVRDTGSGMTPDVVARVFEPFFTTKPVGQGSGLGLPQVLGVAQQLGGGVSLTTAPGAGTALTVFLPRAHAAPAQRPAALAADPTGALAGLRVLLVDDDNEVREITREMLEEMGAEVLAAASGAAALAAVADAGPPDLVLADYTMPEMDGAELCARLRERLPALPAVLMTGYSAAALAERGVARIEVLQKPFRAASLLAAVARATGRLPAQSVAAEPVA